MVMLRSTQPVITYEVYDDRGNSVGCVILPRSARVVGQSQGTVLLRRPGPATPSRDRARSGQESRKAS